MLVRISNTKTSNVTWQEPVIYPFDSLYKFVSSPHLHTMAVDSTVQILCGLASFVLLCMSATYFKPDVSYIHLDTFPLSHGMQLLAV